MAEDEANKTPFTLSFTAPTDNHVTEDALLAVARRVLPSTPNNNQQAALSVISHDLIWQPGARVSIVDMDQVSGCLSERPIPGREHLSPGERVDKSESDNIALRESIKNLDPNTTILAIVHALPGNNDWSIIGAQFPHVKRLVYVAGFDEIFSDGGFPEEWKLDALAVVDVAGCPLAIPHVIKPEIGALLLYYCCSVTIKDDTKEDDAAKEGTVSHDSHISPPASSAIHSLAIYQNDAVDMLARMWEAHPGIIQNLTTLSLCSTSGLDLYCCDGEDVLSAISHLTSLKTLTLLLDKIDGLDVYRDILPALPEQVEELYFQGPVVGDVGGPPLDWTRGFGEGTVLPRLRKIRFRCGFDDKGSGNDGKSKLELEIKEAAERRGLETITQDVWRPQ